MTAQAHLVDFIEAEDLQPAVHVLHQGGQAFHPVAIIAIQNAIDVPNLRMVDVAANHPLKAMFCRLRRHGLLKIIDEAVPVSKSPANIPSFKILCAIRANFYAADPAYHPFCLKNRFQKYLEL